MLLVFLIAKIPGVYKVSKFKKKMEKNGTHLELFVYLFIIEQDKTQFFSNPLIVTQVTRQPFLFRTIERKRQQILQNFTKENKNKRIQKKHHLDWWINGWVLT